MNYDSNQALNLKEATYPELRARFRTLATVEDAVRSERMALNDEIVLRENAAIAKIRGDEITSEDREIARTQLESV